jgi:hypothetical protein
LVKLYTPIYKILKIFFKKYNLHTIFSFLILLCVAFIYLIWGDYSRHEWGDDFAQYIHQSLLILQGKTSLDTGYIYKTYASGLGPPAYPCGFPILLTPVVAIFGVQPAPLIWYINGMSVAALYLTFYWFRQQKFSSIFALLGVLLIWGNRHMIFLKTEIGSDIPFFLFLMAIFILVEWKSSRAKYILLFITLLLAILIRSTGIVLLFSVFVYELYQWYRLKSGFSITKLIHFIIFPMVVISAVILENYFIGQSSSGGYLENLFRQDILIIVKRNITSYFDWCSDLFFENGKVLSWIVLLMIFFGFIMTMFNVVAFHHIFFFSYLFLLMLWPHVSFRFIIPIFPVMVFYIFSFIRISIEKLSLHRYYVWMVILLFSFSSLFTHYRFLKKGFVPVFDGPYDSAFRSAATYISGHTSPDATIVFRKPRALALFTKRKSFVLPQVNDKSILLKEMQNENAQYILIDKTEQPYQEQKLILASDTTITLKEWENERFELYRLK